VGRVWHTDETYVKVAGSWRYVYRAIDERGQVIDVYVSEHRDADAATAFFQQAVESTGRRPQQVTTDKAAAYPPALQAVLPDAEHVTGKGAQQTIERDHQHLKGRIHGMRGFKTDSTAQIVCSGHGFMRSLRDGFYTLGVVMGDPRIPRPPRLMRAWDALTAQLLAG
jgi:transposase-like protein